MLKTLQNGIEIEISGLFYQKNSDFLGLALKTW
jgi:hypothetical protein